MKRPAPSAPAGDGPLVDSIQGISVNCTNLERSLEFYKAIGFKEVADIGESGGGGLEKGLRIPNPRARGRLLKLGDDPGAINLDLIEWLSPRTEGRAYPRLNHAGIARIAVHTANLQRSYEELKARGIEFYSEPQVLQFRDRSSLFVCFEDPDGTVLELIESRSDDAGRK
ncbi:MAG TPA: VOC family protein [Candidatus Binataceae bacterium]|jgi:catechol 2,3-dioxygenase-like lactoylglutathione lyase family enzyme